MVPGRCHSRFACDGKACGTTVRNLISIQGLVRLIEWCRLPGDLVFILLGVIPLVVATGMTYLRMKKNASPSTAPESASA
jgi:hypothetical protein